MQIELNKRIVASRDAESILAIVEKDHGAFNAVNAATACNRLAKTRQGSSRSLTIDDRRVQTLLSTVTRVASDMVGQNVANTLWALATLGWQAGEGSVRCALEGAAVRVAPSMNAQDVVSTVWGLAALGWTVADPHMADRFEASVKALFVDSRRSDVPPAMLTQLFQAHLTSQLLGPTLVALPSPILREAMKAYTEQAPKHTISNDQREVGESLHRLGISYEVEYIAADGLPSIDLAIVGRRIALELDGPSHFTTNTLEPLGHIRMRGRLLSAMGWHVVSIPCFEWSRLRQPFERDAYVLALLRRLPQA
jgi:hypothetical protein